MIDFRLKQAGLSEGVHLFEDAALRRIYERSSGYPRKIAVLCHNALEALVMHDKRVVDEGLISKIIEQEEI